MYLTVTPEKTNEHMFTTSTATGVVKDMIGIYYSVTGHQCKTYAIKHRVGTHYHKTGYEQKLVI